MAQSSELMKDIEELETLEKQATRKKVKDLLTLEIHKLRTQVSNARAREEQLNKKQQQESDTGTGGATPTEGPRPTASHRYTTELSTYGWDQSDKFMKIYVTLDGVQNIAKENVTCQFTDGSFLLGVVDLQNKDYRLHVSNLHGKVTVDGSYHKVKTDMVLVMLKKSEPSVTWPYVTKKDEKKEKKPKADESKNPSDGLMDMLKQMYDDGDDEMKRSIAKAYTESQGKRAAGDMNM